MYLRRRALGSSGDTKVGERAADLTRPALAAAEDARVGRGEAREGVQAAVPTVVYVGCI